MAPPRAPPQDKKQNAIAFWRGKVIEKEYLAQETHKGLKFVLRVFFSAVYSWRACLTETFDFFAFKSFNFIIL